MAIAKDRIKKVGIYSWYAYKTSANYKILQENVLFFLLNSQTYQKVKPSCRHLSLKLYKSLLPTTLDKPYHR